MPDVGGSSEFVPKQYHYSTFKQAVEINHLESLFFLELEYKVQNIIATLDVKKVTGYLANCIY